jgi:hypothetical protein
MERFTSVGSNLEKEGVDRPTIDDGGDEEGCEETGNYDEAGKGRESDHDFAQRARRWWSSEVRR